jgi:NAD(P)-dependent dehydrogenase (short-subunit alcohol dehydrogenase family)
MELNGAVVLVTGGANGIGRALCERFAAEGAEAVVVVDLDGDRAAHVARSLAGPTVGVGLAADVGVEDDVVTAVRTTEERFGRIDLLASNAGIGVAGGVEAPNEAWEQIWAVNVMAHVYAARAALPAMIERGEGYLLQTASAAGLLTNLGTAPYAVTKHAAVALAEWLAITHGDQGIKVSCLCPQGVDTDLLRQGASDPSGASVVAQGVIQPEEVAEAVVVGLRDERFLILPHPEVLGHLQRKAGDYDRWIGGMRKLQRRIAAAISGGGGEPPV